MLRPLAFVAQKDVNTHNRNHEFMMGDSLLISHVHEAGLQEKEVYLPEGNWYYYFDDRHFEGKQLINIETPIDEMPLFVKAGAVVTHYPPMQYVGEKEFEEMILHVYYGEGVTHSILYEDAGDHYGYKNGQYNLVRFKQSSEKKLFRLKKKFVGRYEASYRHHHVFIHGIPFTAKEFIIDGVSHPLKAADVKNGVIELLLERKFEEIIIK
ncbi:DUF5110 domain-containing protein [Chitinophaga sedimenti]|uniref:DUF5110 domain-containing protein n=1 Tax=Chitinophaga sedimenti TaxID=2033606 RepID=UPI003558B791